MLHWTRDRNRQTGTDAAEAIIRQARSIEEKSPRRDPFQPARFHVPRKPADKQDPEKQERPGRQPAEIDPVGT